MAGLGDSPTLSGSDASAEDKISRYLESAERLSQQQKVSNDAPEEEDSDSGDSLFITQKPVPEAVRPGRQRHNLRSHPTSHKESDDDDSSSTSSAESRPLKNERRRKKYSLPKYRFPFLAEMKLGDSLLSAKNGCLHNYVMGGFFKCVKESWKRRQEGIQVYLLPAVDEIKDISPLSEEDEEKAKDEDIKVVERKRFVVPSKAKSSQKWCSESVEQIQKVSEAKQESPREGQTKMLHQNMKNIPLLSDTDCSEHTKSSRSVPSQEERHHEHATADRNSPAKTEITETTRHLTFQQTERELCTDSDATVCELPKSQRQSTQESEEAATAVTMPQTDEMLPAGQTEDAPENLQKKRKKKKKDKGDNESVEERNGQEPEPLHAATSANSPQDDNIQTQEEVDLKEKKKKRKKNKPAAEISPQDMDANLVSDVREEDGGKKKERSGEDVEQLQSESLNYEIKKKKKKKRKREECEDEGTSEMTSNLPQMSTEQLQESVNSLENGAASSQETLGHVKKKKHKKKRHSTSNDVTRDGGESVDLNFCAEDSVNSAKGSGASPKKKTDVLTPEENKVENGNIEETNEIKENNAEVVKKKKKKKKKKNSEMLSSEENVAHDLVSVQEMEKKRTSSFLVADAEEKDAQTDEEQKPLSRVSDAETHKSEEFTETKKKRKRKRKRKMSQHFEEADKASALSEMTEAGVKRKKKHHESLERLSPADEAVVLKKKKKKKFKDHLTQEETPLTATDGAESVKSTCSSVSHKKKGTPASSETRENHIREKKKEKKIKSAGESLLEEKSSIESAELEFREKKKKKKKKPSILPDSPTLSEISLSKPESVTKNKQKKAKRTLHHPSDVNS